MFEQLKMKKCNKNKIKSAKLKLKENVKLLLFYSIYYVLSCKSESNKISVATKKVLEFYKKSFLVDDKNIKFLD